MMNQSIAGLKGDCSTIFGLALELFWWKTRTRRILARRFGAKHVKVRTNFTKMNSVNISSERLHDHFKESIICLLQFMLHYLNIN